MKTVIQRVKSSQVEVEGEIVGQIEQGLLVFLGVGQQDTEEDVDYCVRKITELRIFEDDQGKMNRSAVDINAQILVVSQFTLYGDCQKGRRPSFDKAADPKLGETLYESFVTKVRTLNLKVETGIFRAMMDVHLVNDGPVTLIIESPKK